MAFPTVNWRTTTFVAGPTMRGAVWSPPSCFGGPINQDAFETYVENILVPEFRPDDVMVMDNLSSHKGPRTRVLIDAAGTELLDLPPYYSPDFNPIENASAGEAQGAPPKSCRAGYRRPLGRHRPPSSASTSSASIFTAAVCRHAGRGRPLAGA